MTRIGGLKWGNAGQSWSVLGGRRRQAQCPSVLPACQPAEVNHLRGEVDLRLLLRKRVEPATVSEAGPTGFRTGRPGRRLAVLGLAPSEHQCCTKVAPAVEARAQLTSNGTQIFNPIPSYPAALPRHTSPPSPLPGTCSTRPAPRPYLPLTTVVRPRLFSDEVPRPIPPLSRIAGSGNFVVGQPRDALRPSASSPDSRPSPDGLDEPIASEPRQPTQLSCQQQIRDCHGPRLFTSTVPSSQSHVQKLSQAHGHARHHPDVEQPSLS